MDSMEEYHDKVNKCRKLFQFHSKTDEELQLYLSINLHLLVREEIAERANLEYHRANTRKWQDECIARLRWQRDRDKE